MKRTTKYRIMSAILTGTLFLSNIKQNIITASATTIPNESDNISQEEFIETIDNNQIKKFYTRLYELYDFKTYNTRSIIPQYFQTIYGNKFSCGTIQSAGCGISSLAMVSSYLFDETITPDMMTIYDCGPSPATAFEKGIKRLKLNCEIHRGQAAIDNLDNALDNNHPVIALVGRSSIFTNTGHFIVIAGKTPEGKYIVNDPNIENYYQPNMIDGFTNGFTKEQIARGLNGIYIFDTKEQFKDLRNKELSFQSPSQSKKEQKIEIPSSSIPHIIKQDIVISLSNISLKERPDYQSSTIEIIEKDTELEVLAVTENNYLLVKYNNKTGYIKNEQIKSLLEEVQSLYSELQLQELSIKNIAYLTTDLDIRCGNSIEFASISKISKYETIRILEEYKDWYFVITNERTIGFIPKKYTQIIDGKCIVADKSTKRIYFYNEDKLIYITPQAIISSTSKEGIYDILSKGTNFAIIDPRANWKNTYSSKDTNKVLQKIYSEVENRDSFLIHS